MFSPFPLLSYPSKRIYARSDGSSEYGTFTVINVFGSVIFKLSAIGIIISLE